MSFPEGTRFTEQKHRSQGNALRHLLRPKAGALAMSLNAMGEQFKSLLDVTIVYPDGVPTFWGFLCGRCARVVVRVHQVALTPDLVNGDYAAELAFRQRFHRWLDELWQRKDAEIALLIESAGVPPPRPDDTVAVESLAQFHTVRGSRAAPTGDEMRH
jgi:1-acyl-sn-glycerol-3-phosphate acyltransferase